MLMSAHGFAVLAPRFTLGFLLRSLLCGPIFVPSHLGLEVFASEKISRYAHNPHRMRAGCSEDTDLQGNVRFPRHSPEKFHLNHAFKPSVDQSVVQQSVK